MAKEFKGKIDLDIRDSTPDWDAYMDVERELPAAMARD
jgi:hypothetical protein